MIITPDSPSRPMKRRAGGKPTAAFLALVFVVLLAVPVPTEAQPAPLSVTARSDVCDIQNAQGFPAPFPCSVVVTLTATGTGCDEAGVCTYTLAFDVVGESASPGLLSVRVDAYSYEGASVSACAGAWPEREILEPALPCDARGCTGGGIGTRASCTGARAEARQIPIGKCAGYPIYASLLYQPWMGESLVAFTFLVCHEPDDSLKFVSASGAPPATLTLRRPYAATSISVGDGPAPVGNWNRLRPSSVIEMLPLREGEQPNLVHVGLQDDVTADGAAVVCFDVDDGGDWWCDAHFYLVGSRLFILSPEVPVRALTVVPFALHHSMGETRTATTGEVTLTYTWTSEAA